MLIKAGATSRSIDIWVPDSASTTGAGKTGIAYNAASFKAYYRKGATGSATAITLATQTVGGAFSSGGWVEVDATNMPGLYRFDIPNAAIDTAGFTHIVFSGASGMAPVTLRIQCVAFDPEDTGRLGLTALPNAAAGANGGLPLGDASGRVDVGKVLGTAQTARDLGAQLDVAVSTRLAPTTSGRTLDVTATGEAGIDWANIGSPTTTVNLSGTTVGTVTALAATALAAIWDRATSALTTAGSVGKLLVDNINATISSRQATLTSGDRDAIADALLDRVLSAGANAATDTARSVRNALRSLRNKVSISGSTLTVTMEDDSTPAWTAAVTGTSGADPVTAVDPT